jgi:tetratricopeptide (TPR) repeat protein
MSCTNLLIVSNSIPQNATTISLCLPIFAWETDCDHAQACVIPALPIKVDYRFARRLRMSYRITCPDCRATLKANKSPRSDKLMQCLKCGHRFTLSDSWAASSSTSIVAAKSLPIVRATSKTSPRVLLGAVAVMFLAAAGLFGAYFASLPVQNSRPSKSTAIVAEKATTPPEPVAEAKPNTDVKPETEDEAELERRRQQFTQLMIDAGIAARLKKHDEAVAAYADAARLFPDDIGVQQKLADARAALEVHDKKRRDDEQAQKEATALLKQGQAAFDRDQLAAAIDFFKLALQKSSTNEEAAQKLLLAQSRLQKIDAEKKSLDAFDGHILRGKAALQAGRPADALREFRAAGKVLPNDPLPPELVKDAEKQLALGKNEADPKKQFEALLAQGVDLLRRKRLDDADNAIRQALKLYPDDPVASRALNDVQKGLKQARADVANLTKKAQDALAAGQVPAAKGFLRDAEQILPTDDKLLRVLRVVELIQLNQAAYSQAIAQATAAMAIRRYGDALLAYSEALRIVPNDPLATVGYLEAQRGLALLNRRRLEYDVHINQGILLLRNQRYVEAARSFENALRLVRPPLLPDPQALSLARYADAMSQGAAALGSRQFPLAARFYQLALNESPNDPHALLGLQKARLGVRS